MVQVARQVGQGRSGLMGTARRGENNAGLRRHFVALCAAVVVLCIGHQLLMASDRHATVMGSAHGWTGGTLPAAPLAGAMGVHRADLASERVPEMPLPLLGDCPAQQAVVPLLLLLVLLIGGTGGWWMVPGAGGAACRLPVRSLPPPLPPAKRRALLQVFRI